MIDLRQVRELVIRPALQELGLWSESAEALLVGTGLVESGFVYLRQVPDGPALGFWQMEPATHYDLWDRWLRYRPRFADIVVSGAWADPRKSWPPPASQLVTDLRYAVMCARLQYYRDPSPLPGVDDVAGLAAYWKRVWNTNAGAGDPSKFVTLYEEYVR